MEAPRNHRLFVALDPPEPVRRRLAARQAELRRAAGRAADDVRWIPAVNLHLTVQFLGAVPGPRVEAVRAAVRAAAAAGRPLSLTVNGAGGFPNARRPRVLWVGLEGDVEPARALATDLAARLAPLGFPPDARPWSPHLTVGRARAPHGASGVAGALAAGRAEEPIPWRVAELVLFESHLGSGGPRYEAVERAALGSAGHAG